MDFEISGNSIHMMVMCTSYFVFGSNNCWGFPEQNMDCLCHLCKSCYLLVSATPPRPLNGFPWNIKDFPIAKHGLRPFQRLWGVRYIFVSKLLFVFV